jgi:hypothetical protein
MKTISDHITDLVQNSIRAGATVIDIMVSEYKNSNLYSVNIKDNGTGMEEEIVKKAADPFYTTRKTRKTGLGLALVKQAAEQTGGQFNLTSEPGKGTTLDFSFGLDHFDRPPLGKIADTLLLLIISNIKIIFRYTHSTESGTFNFDSSELLRMLEGIPLTNTTIMNSVRSLFDYNLKELNANY